MTGLAGRRVIITGASGFVGSHLLRRLVGLGCDVVGLVRPSSDLWRIRDLLGRVEIASVDLGAGDGQALEVRLSDAHLVWHLAAAGVNPSVSDAMSILATNVLGTCQILQAANAVRVERFIYCGSCFEYGPGSLKSEAAWPAPVSEYGASKAAAWMLAHTYGRRHGLPVVALRPFTVYGPFEAGHRLIPYTIVRALANAPMELTGGEQQRDFVFIEDAVDAFIAAAIQPEALGDTFNVCSGSATPIREVVATIIGLTGSTAVPRFGALPYRETELATLSGDPSRASRTLGWTARTSLPEGLAKTIQWFRHHQPQHPAYSGA